MQLTEEQHKLLIEAVSTYWHQLPANAKAVEPANVLLRLLRDCRDRAGNITLTVNR